MEKRKNPEKELRNKSGLFFQIGLLAALMLCVSAFEYRTGVVEPTIDLPDELEKDEVLPPITEIKQPKPPPKPVIVKLVETQDPVEVDPDLMKQIAVEIEPTEYEPQVLDAPPIEIIDEIIEIAEVMPQPVGGYSKFYQYISDNIRYPRQARQLELEGKVFVQFVVDKDGRLTDFVIIKGIGAGCDEEVLHVMAEAPAWEPGKQRGKPVRVRQLLPIQFKLN